MVDDRFATSRTASVTVLCQPAVIGAGSRSQPHKTPQRRAKLETLRQPPNRSWDVLLIGGVSGAGKTTAAEELGRRLSIPWIGVDDLRLAFQWSRVSLPERTDALYFFLDTPDVWSQPPNRLRDGLIDIGELMSPAIEVVVGNHLDNAGPVIIEGDGVLPSIVERPEIRAGIDAGRVRTVFVSEGDVERLYRNYRARPRGPGERPDEELRAEARAKTLFNAWLAEEAGRRHLPVIPSQPFASLPDRILAAADSSHGSTTTAP